ncbi:PTS system IIA component [Enterococcus moraviensis ATCC BAA-383]|uniref:PTS system IIA component n=1 Tax=Enterococcus moraviensis ATCC BAA-383 TaxID=1158609 RepID=R2SLX1_9ENTE|nr:PTS IIA component [Enterococcus moraviensis]EOH96145.1 PTS system IIA component [Enterococcus moraviensis ATCC BAA-383]EOT66117.1 PTS system IIA component [Enterococcus moraviensis ATCC BAA-383]OJG65742.1 PTS system IIA component [Enterococcus moraviensis]
MENLVLVSHGHFCTELKNSAEMIMGPQDNIYTVPLLAEEGEKEFLDKFETITHSLDHFIVFSDLLGGTPCNILSKKILNGESFELYAGMNLPMVISFVNANLIESQSDFVTEAKENTVKVNERLANDVFDEEDE